MSILIKGVKLTDCWNCPCVDGEYGECNVLGKAIKSVRGRLDDCPLTELPAHGALIDKDALYERTEEWEAQALAQIKEYCCGESSWEQNECRKWKIILGERSAFKFEVADASVVIPAERSEHG